MTHKHFKYNINNMFEWIIGLFSCCINSKKEGITITISFNCCNKRNKRKSIKVKKLTFKQVELIENYIKKIVDNPNESY
jgi:ribosomal protein S13